MCGWLFLKELGVCQSFQIIRKHCMLTELLWPGLRKKCIPFSIQKCTPQMRLVFKVTRILSIVDPPVLRFQVSGSFMFKMMCKLVNSYSRGLHHSMKKRMVCFTYLQDILYSKLVKNKQILCLECGHQLNLVTHFLYEHARRDLCVLLDC